MPPRKRKAVSYAESDDGDDQNSSSGSFDDSSEESIENESLSENASSNSEAVAKKKKASPKKGSPSKPPAAVKASKSVPSPQKKKSSESTKPTAKKPTAASSSSSVVENSTPAPSFNNLNSNSSIDITQGPAVVTEAGAKKLVLQYMKQQNRPYSMIQIHDNLHKRIPKATLEKVLVALTCPSCGLSCKEYGKSKIYYVDQTTLTADYTADQLESLQDENEESKQVVNNLSAREKDLKTQLQGLESQPNDLELDRVLKEFEESVAEKQSKVDSLLEKCNVLAGSGNKKSSGGLHNPNALKTAIKKFNDYRKEWFERRSVCFDVVEMLSESLSQKPKKFMEDLGLETDDDVKVLLPPIMKEPK